MSGMNCVYLFLVSLYTDKNIYANDLISVQECAETVYSMKYYVDILWQKRPIKWIFCGKNVKLIYDLLWNYWEMLSNFSHFYETFHKIYKLIWRFLQVITDKLK